MKAQNLKEAYTAIYTSSKISEENELVNEEYDVFDYILEHLISEGYADDVDAALVMMSNMSEEWRKSIINEELAQQISMFNNKGTLQRYASSKGNLMYPFPKFEEPKGSLGPFSRLPPYEPPPQLRTSTGQLSLDLSGRNPPSSPRTPPSAPPSTPPRTPPSAPPSSTRPRTLPRTGVTLRGIGPGFPPPTGSSSRFNPRGVNSNPLRNVAGALGAASLLKNFTNPLGGIALALTPTPTSSSDTRSTATQVPTRPGQVPVGGVYYNPDKRVGTQQRMEAQRRVGTNIRPASGAGYRNIPGVGQRYFSSSDGKWYRNYNDALAARNSRLGNPPRTK